MKATIGQESKMKKILKLCLDGHILLSPLVTNGLLSDENIVWQ